jgi:RNA polymerase sigma-70 factor (ECF subfamily)
MQQSDRDIEEEWRIIQRAQRQPEAFGLIYEKYYGAIFGFVERRVGDTDLAADVVSQVFLKAMLQLDRYQHKGLPFSAWLYRVASNQVAEHYRKTQRSRVVSLDTGHFERLLADAEAPEAGAQAEAAALVQALLAQLGNEEVQLLELRFFEERPFKEVAYILGITENNAKVRAYRIIEKLKKIVHR